ALVIGLALMLALGLAANTHFCKAAVAGRLPSIEPDWQISRIRLSNKPSRLHPRHVVLKRGQAYEPEVPVKVREWISPYASGEGHRVGLFSRGRVLAQAASAALCCGHQFQGRSS